MHLHFEHDMQIKIWPHHSPDFFTLGQRETTLGLGRYVVSLAVHVEEVAVVDAVDLLGRGNSMSLALFGFDPYT